jgi:hypothetical protein
MGGAGPILVICHDLVSSETNESEVASPEQPLQPRRVIAVGCFILGAPLLLLGLVLAFVSALDAGIHEVLPAHDYETILAFFLPGLALYLLGAYPWSRPT